MLEALSLFPRPDYYVPYSNLKKLDLIASLHAGISSIVYGYSGFATIEYGIEGQYWDFQIDENGGIRNFRIPNFDKDALTADPFRIVERLLKDRLKSTSDSSLYDGEKISRLVFFIPNDTSFMNELSTRTSDTRSQNMIVKSGAHARVVKELINKCIDDKYTEILMISPPLRARKERADGQPLYINVKDLGDGVEKVAITTLWLDAINPALVLWDDFEGSAHPSLIKELLKWLSKKKWQVVLATHSIDVLNSLVEVGPKDTRIIQLKKTNEDILYHANFSLGELEDILDSSQDPRMMIDTLKL